jgi:zinc transporter ZupT
MDENKNAWRSFQGCVIAVMPLTVGTLSGIAAYGFFRILEMPVFLTAVLAFIVGSLVFMSAYLLKKKLGE